MNKLIIVLLLAAIGAGTFFYLQKNVNQTNAIKKELIIGKWKTVSYQPVKDSSQPMYYYEFLNEGVLLRSVNDSSKADSFNYYWDKKQNLTWKEKSDSAKGSSFSVLKLNKDSLELKSLDSLRILFLKTK